MVGRGSDLYQLCKDIDETIKGIFVNYSVSLLAAVYFTYTMFICCACFYMKVKYQNSSFISSAGLYKNGQLVEHTDCKPWVEDSYWEIKRSNNAIIEEAYKQFNGKSFHITAVINHEIMGFVPFEPR